jgi:hypothetical protein
MQNSALDTSPVDSPQKKYHAAKKQRLSPSGIPLGRPEGVKEQKRNLTKSDLENIAIWDSHELARYLNVSYACIRQWRHDGLGPPYLKIQGYAIRYEREVVMSWLADQRRPRAAG